VLLNRLYGSSGPGIRPAGQLGQTGSVITVSEVMLLSISLQSLQYKVALSMTSLFILILILIHPLWHLSYSSYALTPARTSEEYEELPELTDEFFKAVDVY
jgi:hypothetical protein